MPSRQDKDTAMYTDAPRDQPLKFAAFAVSMAVLFPVFVGPTIVPLLQAV